LSAVSPYAPFPTLYLHKEINDHKPGQFKQLMMQRKISSVN